MGDIRRVLYEFVSLANVVIGVFTTAHSSFLTPSCGLLHFDKFWESYYQPLTGLSTRGLSDTMYGVSNPHDAAVRNRVPKVGTQR